MAARAHSKSGTAAAINPMASSPTAASPAMSLSPASTVAVSDSASSTASVPAVEFEGRRWYRLSVPPCELRLEITLGNGQCFGWRRIDAKKESTALDTVHAIDPLFARLNEAPSGGSKAESSSTPAAAAAAAGAPPSPDDPHYVGVINSSVISFRQTPDDVLYTEHATLTGAPTPTDSLDATIRDFLHLPPSSGASTNDSQHADKLLRDLYPTWCANATPRFRFIAAAYPGVRVLRQNPFECLFSFICSSNNNIARITQMLDALRTSCGTRIPLTHEQEATLGGRAFFTFPSLDQLSTLTESDLRAKGYGYRAKYIVQSALLLREKGGRSYLLSLRSPQLTRADVETALLAFAGVGPKVAACIALFSLDRLDAIPCDTHVWKIALRDYVQQSRMAGVDLHKVKTLNARIMAHVGDVFRSVFGDRAGWAHCLLFLAELPEFKRRLAALGLEVAHPPAIVKETKKRAGATNQSQSTDDEADKDATDSDQSESETEMPPAKKPAPKASATPTKAPSKRTPAATIIAAFPQAKRRKV